MSRQGAQPSDANLRAIAECSLPPTYMEIHAFLGLMGHYQQFIKAFTQIAQPLNEHLAREGASRKPEQVLLSEGALEAFQALKQACMRTPILAFTDYSRDSYSKQMLLKRDWEWYSPRTNRWTISPSCLW